MQSRTQGSRLKSKNTKKSEVKASPFVDRLSRGQGRNAGGQGQGPRTQAARLLKKKGLKKIFQAISEKRGLHCNFSDVLQKKRSSKFLGDLQNFNNLKNSAGLEPRTGQFSRT